MEVSATLPPVVLLAPLFDRIVEVEVVGALNRVIPNSIFGEDEAGNNKHALGAPRRALAPFPCATEKRERTSRGGGAQEQACAVCSLALIRAPPPLPQMASPHLQIYGQDAGQKAPREAR